MDAFRNDAGLEDSSAIGLVRGRLLRLENARGTQVRVEHGLLWITQDGDIRDVMVRGGESFLLDRDGVAILTACGRTALTVFSCQP